MQWQGKAAVGLAAAIAALASSPSQSQVRRFVTPPDQVVAIRAGQMFDARTGTMVPNQVVLDRVPTDVGPSVQISAGARVSTSAWRP